MTTAASELYSVFDARRVKLPELKGLDIPAHAFTGYVKNRVPVLARLKKQAAAVDAMEADVKDLADARFKDEVEEMRVLMRLNRLKGDAYLRAFALAREAAVRTLGKRPYTVQIMGAMAMTESAIAEMATGEGKTLTAGLAAGVLAWSGKPVHIITVNDYLVQRDCENMSPLYRKLGHEAGYVIHDTTPMERVDIYRRNIVYITSKELVADFLRDQIMLGNLRTSGQTAVSLLGGMEIRSALQVPGLFKVIVDEADSLLIDEAVTPLIISNSPEDEPNADRYRAAAALAEHLEKGKDFKIDTEIRHIDFTDRGREKLDAICAGDASGFWKGSRRREELVAQALTAKYCFLRDEHYLVDPEGKIQIIDEFTGRVMADRSWRHGLHQAIEIKEAVKITADKENLARLSFQRFFRQYPTMCGMTGTAWEAAPEFWQIYNRPIVRIPTNKPCIRVQLPLRMYDTNTQKLDAVVKRVIKLNDKGVPVLVGTRSVWASDDISKRLTAAGRNHRVLNAAQNEQEANIIAEAGHAGRITVATNMAGRGTDIELGRGVRELGGLHVIATEPNTTGRIDRQLFGRAARQGDPGTAQMFACAEDDLFIRHAPRLRRMWRAIGANRLIKIAQARAEKLARFNRKQVLRSDDWMDQSVPF
jgi:preprotein translocase subunit SecA